MMFLPPQAHDLQEPQQHRDEEQCPSPSLVRVGARPSLPTVYVADETVSGAASALRMRNCGIPEERTAFGTPGSYDCASSSGVSSMEKDWSSFDWTPVSGDSLRKEPEKDCSGFRFVNNRTSYETPCWSDDEKSFYRTPKAKLEEVLSSSLAGDLRRRLFGGRRRKNSGRRGRLFDTDSSLSASDALAVVVAVVVVSSCVLAVLTLTGGLRRGDAGSFGGRKYDSIAFGADRRLARLRQEGRMLTDDLVDEEGNRLGGKRAAMQYAANLRRRNNIAEMEEEEEVEEWMAEEGELGAPALDSDSDESLESLGDLLQPRKGEDPEALGQRRRELVEKIAAFGHFATTKVKSETNQQEEGKKEEVVEDENGEEEEEVQHHESVEDITKKILEGTLSLDSAKKSPPADAPVSTAEEEALVKQQQQQQQGRDCGGH